MQKLFGISLTTLAGYAGFFMTLFGSAAAATVSVPGCPHWVPLTFAILGALAGALRVTVGHMTNDAPNPPLGSPVTK
jgi:hypothetical protein